jgi:hypothetical protein
VIHLSLLKTTGSVARVPAPEIETLVLVAARDHLETTI